MTYATRWLGAAMAALVAAGASAQGVDIFKDADLALGARLMQEHKCQQCHAAKFGGDGSAVYRPGERITTPGLLRGMVEQCNTELGLGMFPEEVTAVGAVLQRDHYRFK
jgi:hypothetical protein